MMTDKRVATFLRAAACVAAASCFSAGCGAINQSLAANKRSPGAIENGAFKPARPPEANYGPDPALTCPSHGANDIVQSALDRNASPGKPRVEPDGRLCAMADTLLGWPLEEKNTLPPPAVSSFLSQYFGLPAPPRSYVLQEIPVDVEKPENIASAVTDPIASFAANASNPRYGFYFERVKKGSTRISLVLADLNVELQPLPRKLAPGTSATLSGKLLGDLQKPRITVVDPVGHLEKVEGEGQSFKTELKCGDKPGRILVQLIGEKQGADLLVGSFPVYCGMEPALAVKMPVESKGPQDPAQFEQQMVQLTNADRTAAGLKPLEPNAGLADVARAMSQQRAAGKGITSSDLMQRLKEKDISAPIILVSAGEVAGGAEDAYARFSESPQDRANAMSPDVTMVGVGAVAGPSAGGKPSTIVTELFVKQLPPPDPAAIKQKLYEAIARKRAEARTTEMAKDPVLEEVAQKYADAAAANGGQVPKDKEGPILAPLYKQSMTVNELGGFVRDEQNALDIAEQPSITGNAKLVGVGVGVGTSPQFGKNSPFVMVFMGTRHEAAKATHRKKHR